MLAHVVITPGRETADRPEKLRKNQTADSSITTAKEREREREW
jgi:hypothetical protein